MTRKQLFRYADRDKARYTFNKYIKANDNFIYCDTDSIYKLKDIKEKKENDTETAI